MPVILTHIQPPAWVLTLICSLPSLLLVCLRRHTFAVYFWEANSGGKLSLSPPRWQSCGSRLHPLNLHRMDLLTHEHTRETRRKHNMWRQVLLRDVTVRRRNLFFSLYLTWSGTEQGCVCWGGGWSGGYGGRMRGKRVGVKQSGNVVLLLLLREEPTSSLGSA